MENLEEKTKEKYDLRWIPFAWVNGDYKPGSKLNLLYQITTSTIILLGTGFGLGALYDKIF